MLWSRYSTQWSREDSTARNGGKGKEAEKIEDNYGKIPHIYIRYDSNSKSRVSEDRSFSHKGILAATS